MTSDSEAEEIRQEATHVVEDMLLETPTDLCGSCEHFEVESLWCRARQSIAGSINCPAYIAKEDW